VLYSVFFASGAAALIYQSGWQRILTLHAGMDLYSVTTVIAAFMAGLGLGNLLGGGLADRVDARASVLLYALMELFVGAFGALSVQVLQYLYPRLSSLISTTPRQFAFHFALLLIPTTMMGTTLPLLARGIVARSAEIAPSVGRLYGVNTLGAAVGAFAMAGPWILGRLGLQGAIGIAAGLNVAAGLLALRLATIRNSAAAPAKSPSGGDDSPGDASHLKSGFAVWATIYGLTGFAALGLEVAWFRLLNVVGRSTTYTFSRLLFVYLVGLGLGSLLGGRLARRLTRPARTFLLLQAAIGLAALVGPLLVTAYFEHAGGKRRVFPRDVLAPLVVLLPPTVLMGVCFPIMNRVVSNRLDTLGRRTGALLCANTLGCVLGTLATGFFFLRVYGTAATLRLLAGVLCALAAAALLAEGGRVVGRVVGLAGGFGVLAWLLPTGVAFWAPLHGAPPKQMTTREDGSCVLGLFEERPQFFGLYISGMRQNAVPFDDFHVRLGAVPALIHPAPRRALVIGLGMGSTPHGLAVDPRVEHATCVEICAGELALLDSLYRKGMRELEPLISSPRLDYRFEDGRKYLLDSAERFDLVITDTLLPLSPFSGSLYSREFYQLVSSRLRVNGMFAQWVPSRRILETAASVFPFVFVIEDPASPASTRFLVASNRPIKLDRNALLERNRGVDRSTLPAETRRELEEFLARAIATQVVGRDFAPNELNTDLFPRDEFSSW